MIKDCIYQKDNTCKTYTSQPYIKFAYCDPSICSNAVRSKGSELVEIMEDVTE